MKKYKNIALCILILTFVMVVIGCGVYSYQIGAVSKDTNVIEVTIPEKTSTKGIAKILKDKSLIRDETFFMIYVKLFQYNDLKSGIYDLNQSMGVKGIVEELRKGSTRYPGEISITFKEGLTMRGIAKVIAENTSHTEEEVFAKVNDATYLDSVIERYWFLTDEIKNKEIYYKLEGYLYPETYRFKNKDVAVDEIFNKMLAQMEIVLNPFKDKIQASGSTVHQIITMASIVESETAIKKDRAKVAGVFYNRLKSNMNLGSDVTTYYGVRRELNSGELTKVQYNTPNAYNTRVGLIGQLPVGPISNPSMMSIEAALSPAEHNFYFFFANIATGETFFTKTYEEHLKVVAQFKNQ